MSNDNRGQNGTTVNEPLGSLTLAPNVSGEVNTNHITIGQCPNVVKRFTVAVRSNAAVKPTSGNLTIGDAVNVETSMVYPIVGGGFRDIAFGDIEVTFRPFTFEGQLTQRYLGFRNGTNVPLTLFVFSVDRVEHAKVIL